MPAPRSYAGSSPRRRTKEALSGLHANQAAWLGLATEAARALESRRARDDHERTRVAEALAGVQARTRQLVHDARTPLSVLRNYLGVLRTKPSASAAEDLRLSEEEVERVEQLLQKIASSASQANPPGVIDLNSLLKEIIQLSVDSGFTPKGTETHLGLDKALPLLQTERNAAKQIVLNLLRNAIEAMGDRGQVCVSTRDRIYLDDRDYVEIQISDSGPGIPEPVLMKLFQPVKSTRGPGHSGLGLSIVRRLVQELGGRVGCSRGDSAGTVFRILLPRKLG
jgi:signal transduction histidine kinase